MSWEIYHGDSRQLLDQIPEASVDSIVTDAPYELAFMGKRWDASGIAFDVKLWHKCLRALKPGGHLLAFGGTRTYHRMVCAIEDAGFDIRDSIHWIYGSGFPKSLNVSKAIDKANGTTAKREIVHEYSVGGNAGTTCADKGGTYVGGAPNSKAIDLSMSTGGCDAAKKWDGFGTALKPAHEPIVVARKPMPGTVANNALAYGCGALNIDGCRVGTDWDEPDRPSSWRRSGNTAQPGSDKIAAPDGTGIQCHPGGRWPPNVLFSHGDDCDCPVAELDRQSKNAARFFPCFRYQAKANRSERESGCESLSGAGRRNTHPTVKPIEVMRWLVRLVTPQGGTALDPFAGSGTTGCACVIEGRNFIGFELHEHYCKIARARILHQVNKMHQASLDV